MPKTIQQLVEFDGVSPEKLFEIYIDSKKHSAAINAKAIINPGVGGEFKAFEGNVHGKNLFILPKQIIVQTWRAQPWKENDPDSILILIFSKTTDGGRIELVQANVPDHAYNIINDGWETQYWKPWKNYLRQ